MKLVDYKDYHFLRRNLRRHIRDAIIAGYSKSAIIRSIGLDKGEDNWIIAETFTRWWDEGNEKMALLLLIVWHYRKKGEPVRIRFSRKAEFYFWEGIRPNSLASLIRTNFEIGERK